MEADKNADGMSPGFGWDRGAYLTCPLYGQDGLPNWDGANEAQPIGSFEDDRPPPVLFERGGIGDVVAAAVAAVVAAVKAAEEVVEKTFLELHMEDEDGQPLANESYKVVLPDGTVKEGKLDGSGKARIDGIDSDHSHAHISFPGMHNEGWA